MKTYVWTVSVAMSDNWHVHVHVRNDIQPLRRLPRNILLKHFSSVCELWTVTDAILVQDFINSNDVATAADR